MTDSIVARLKILLGIDSSEFSDGTKKAGTDMDAFGARVAKGAKLVAGAIAALGLKAMIEDARAAARESISLAKDMTSAASAIGVSTDELQRYRYVAIEAGIAQNVMEDGLGKLNQKLGEAAEGSKSAAALFDRIGVSVRDANGQLLAGASALPLVIDGLAGIEDQAVRTALMNKIFGDSVGPKLAPLLSQGSEGIAAMSREFHALGLSISGETLSKLGELGKDLEKLNQEVAGEQAKAIANNSEAIKNYERVLSSLRISMIRLVGSLDDLDKATARWDAWMGAKGKATAQFFAGIWKSFEQWNDRAIAWADDFGRTVADMQTRAINAMRDMVMGIGEWIGTRLNAIFDAARAKVRAAGDWFFELYDRVVGHSYIPDMVDEIGQHMRRLDAEMVEPARRSTQTAADMFRALQREVSGIMSRLFPEQAAANRHADEVRAINEYYDVLIKRGGDALAIDREREAVLRRLHSEYDGWDKYVASVAGSKVELAPGQKTIEDIAAELAMAETSIGAFGKKAETVNVRIVESFARMVDGSLRQIDRFVNGIKSGNWLDIIGGLLNAIDSIAAIVTGGKGWNVGPVVFGGGGQAPSQTPGFARGGSMRLGGFAGIDRNMLSLNGRPLARVSAGETMTITPANAGGGGRSVYFDNRGAVMTDDLLRQMNSMVASGIAEASPHIARAGAAQALGTINRLRERTL